MSRALNVSNGAFHMDIDPALKRRVARIARLEKRHLGPHIVHILQQHCEAYEAREKKRNGS